MIHPKLIAPQSIAVIGGSNNPNSPGGKILDNLLQNNYQGKIYVVNPKKNNVKNLPTFQDVSQLPEQVDTAIIAVAAKYIPDIVNILTEQKNTRGFIIISAGFSDTGKQGKQLEQKIVKQIEKYGGSLLGPNNIGLINSHYAGVFTTPVPKLDPGGIDLISGSGATAVFIMEAAMQMGLTFNSIWSVGNSAQIGVEEVLEYMDNTHTKNSSKIIMLYIESIQKPEKLLKHSRSLVRKGCRIVAIKSGNSVAGSRAASSHTGALAGSDLAVATLFEKAGILRAYGRNEIIQLAAVLQYGLPQGKNITVVTHAGGPGVMLTDILEKNNINVPEIKGKKAEQLKEKLFAGSSVNNPIDFLATGTAQHLDEILKAVENDFDQIDATAVIFGSPGLFQVYEAYDVIIKHIQKNKKPVYPILPSVVNVANEISYFHQKGFAGFPDEVLFGKAFARAYHHNRMLQYQTKENLIEKNNYKKSNQNLNKGYLPLHQARQLLNEFDFPLIKEAVFTDVTQAMVFARNQYPVVLKVVGILHKTDINGVRLNINNEQELKHNFEELMQIPQAKAVLIQPQQKGLELFVGIKKEDNFGHLILFGLGGIYIEVLKDFQTVLAPTSQMEIRQKLKQLKTYKLLTGIRGQKGIDIETFIDLIQKTSDMITAYPSIVEMDLNPILATEKAFYVVDYRIRIE